MRPSTSLCALAAAAVVPASLALNIEFTKVSTGGSYPYSFATLDKSTAEGDSFDFENSQNSTGSDIYVATITVGGKDYAVQLDTGSSDLWIDTTGVDLSGFTNTGEQAVLTYGDTTVAQGDIYIGEVTFGDFTISNQAFIAASGTNATTNGDTGLLGVGPPLLSVIADTLNGTQYNGDTVVENILADNSSVSEFLTFSLSRSFSTGLTDGGVFSIGEVDTNFTSVTNSPKLEVIETARWVVFMDGIIVNGQNFSGGSIFTATGQGENQTLSNLDTGTSLALIPQAYAEVIYGSIPGAQYDATDGLYIVPCDAVVSLSFVFGGVEYPMNPIDTVTAAPDGNGGVLCYSGFTIATPDASQGFDFLLGDSFLRNVYAVFDYGNLLNGTTDPYIQLLSTTDASSAASEYESLSASRNESIISDASSSSSSSTGGSSSSGSLSLSSPSWTSAVLGASTVFAGLLLL